MSKRTCSTCKHYVPAWEGNKTSMFQPAFCLKKKITLTKNCEKKQCDKYEIK